jgi:hypothetical protein
MNLNGKVNIWLKNGSIFKEWVLVGADLKISGISFDVNVLQKVDDAYLYDTAGSQIFRELVTGSIKVRGPGLNQPLSLDLEMINEMLAVTSN